MSDDGQGLVMWQRQAPFAPSWTAGSDGGGGGGRGRGGREGGGYNGFRPTAPVFVPGQVRECTDNEMEPFLEAEVFRLG